MAGKSIALILCLIGGPCFAGQTIAFGPKETQVEGSIRYSVIGKYIAHFREFQGRIAVDRGAVQAVFLDIKLSSIHSNCPWCDRIVCSRRLLNVAKYPDIIFKSRKILHTPGGYKVTGTLRLHGLAKPMTFLFKMEGHGRALEMEGSWRINRKDFGIVWNKALDHGGVLVSDTFTVDWRLKVST